MKSGSGSVSIYCFFSYAIYLCFGIPPYFIGVYERLIFPLAVNNLISLLVRHFRILMRGE